MALALVQNSLKQSPVLQQHLVDNMPQLIAYKQWIIWICTAASDLIYLRKPYRSTDNQHADLPELSGEFRRFSVLKNQNLLKMNSEQI